MTGRRCSVVLVRRLGRRLRVTREKAGMSVEQAARMLEKSVAGLRRIESGTTRADTHLVRSMMDLYDVRDDCLLELARRAGTPVWWRGYALPNEDYVGLEAEADSLYAFGALRIPDLLQADGYATALAEAHGRSGMTVRAEIAARAIRWQRLGATHNPLRLHVILDEAVFGRPIGGPAAMAEQTAHLLRSAQQPGVSIQIIPRTIGAHAGVSGSFTVLIFPEPEDPDTVYLEHVGGTHTIDNPTQVHTTRQHFEHLRGTALSPAESLDLLRHTGGAASGRR